MITEGCSDHNIKNLSVKRVLIASFLKHDIDEIVACCTAAGLLHRNLIEQVHSTSNFGFHSTELMRKVNKEKGSTNSNKEILKD